jgi:hypothetical protein
MLASIIVYLRVWKASLMDCFMDFTFTVEYYVMIRLPLAKRGSIGSSQKGKFNDNMTTIYERDTKFRHIMTITLIFLSPLITTIFYKAILCLLIGIL